MASNRELKIMTWNARSIRAKQSELRDSLSEHRIDIALIQETWLKPTQRLSIQGYSVYRNDRTTSRGGGTAVLVRNDIKHLQLPTQKLQKIEYTSVQVHTDRFPINFTSFYRKAGQHDPDEFKSFFMNNPSPSIIGGDFNAHHEMWQHQKSNPPGEQLVELSDLLNLALEIPDEPTMFQKNGRRSNILDFFIISDVNRPADVNVVDELDSDHRPVILTLGDCRAIEVPRVQIKRKTDWDKFQKILLQSDPIPAIAIPSQIEPAILKFTRDILSAYEDSTSENSIPLQTADTSFPTRLKVQIRVKNRLSRRARATGDPADKRVANAARRDVRSAVAAWKAEKWETLLADQRLDGPPSIWRLAGALAGKARKRIPPLKSPETGNFAVTDQEKAELMASTFETQMGPPPPDLLDPEFISVIREAEDIKPSLSPDYLHDFLASPGSIKTMIGKLSSRKAPGSDKITVTQLKKLPFKQFAELANIINAIIRLQHFPTVWKHAHIAVIPKRLAKNSTADYRPISLLSSISKLAERVILQALQSFMFENNLIPNEQFGFRESHSAVHQASRMVFEVHHAFRLSKKIGAVFLDLTKAFDKVWHHGLVAKAWRLGLPEDLIALIKSFLKNRTFQVKIGDCLSSPRPIFAGVPQGSPLAPALFNLYISDFPVIPKVKSAFFADDTAIFTVGRNVDFMIKTLQKQLNESVKWLKFWKLQINPLKTQAIFFHKKRVELQLNELVIEKVQIPWLKKATYLGLLFDRRLSWSPQIQQALQKGNGLLSVLSPLMCRTSTLPASTKSLIYMLLIRSVAYYGATAYYSFLSKNQAEQIQSFQSKILRLCLKAPWFVRNSQIHRELDIPPVHVFIKDQITKFNQKSIHAKNPFIRELSNSLAIRLASNFPEVRLK